MFIGKQKIKDEIYNADDDTYSITFKEGNTIKINKNLYDLIKKEKEGNGEVSEVIATVLGTKFLMEMADFGLDYSFVERMAQYMGNIVYNTREEKIGKVFGCTGAYTIPLKKLLEDYEK